MPVSNDNGRVLEYMIVKQIKNTLKNKCKLTSETIRQNDRDIKKIPLIASSLIEHFKKNTPQISDWIIEKFNGEPVTIERISDSAGQRGDVTDIRIQSKESSLNISCKNNNLSIKHQRPGPTPNHFGFKKKDEKTKIFEQRYKKINSEFFKTNKSKNINLKYYNEISEEDKIDKLYTPICKLVNEFINDNSGKGINYQNFLLGEIDYVQIVLNQKNIEIKSFKDLPKSNLVTSNINEKGYVIVNFHNKIILSMRLHNASSRISEAGSLKFDTKVVNMDIPMQELKCI